MAQPFWPSLTAEDQEVLRTAGTMHRLPRGTLLCREGQEPGRVFVLASGRVEVSRDDASGQRTVLAWRGPGDVIGELSALDMRPMSATVAAIGPTTALVIPARRFAEVCRQRPYVSWHVMTSVASRLRDSDEQRTRSRVAVRDRTVLVLLELAAVEPGARPDQAVELRLTQQDLADQVGASLVSVTRALEELRGLGALETRRGRILVNTGALLGMLPPELR